MPRIEHSRCSMSTSPAVSRCSVSCFDDCYLPPPKALGRKPHYLDEPIAKMGAVIEYERGFEIFGQGQPADNLYRVVTGAVRASRILNNGRRQICEFYLPGDYFGLELDREHTTSAFAINDVQAVATNGTMVTKLIGRRRDVTQQLLAIKDKQLERLQGQILLITRTAEERIAWFLLQIARRTDSYNVVFLPMPYQDIADHLGLTMETVSRTMKQLRTTGWIEPLSSRRIELINLAALTQLVS